MIRYALKCSQGHGFESWFQSAAAYDRLAASGHVTCMVCGDRSVEKTLMAPAVRPARLASPETGSSPMAMPGPELVRAIAALRAQVEQNSDYVGLDFAAEARAIHSGSAPERSIYGEARPDEARALIADGIPVAPLPFLPSRKAN